MVEHVSAIRPESRRTVAVGLNRLILGVARHWLLALNLILAVFVSLPWLAPVLMQTGQPGLGRAIYLLYSTQCHQLPQRSYFLFGPQVSYSLTDIQAAWVKTNNPMVLRQYLGSAEMGWKVAWSCGPCRLEMPELVRVYEGHKADGFVVLAVNLTYQDVREDVQPYVDEFGMTFPVLFDADGAVAGDLYRMRGQPLSVFVNREGVIARIRVGAMTPEIVDEYLADILD